ncbi:MAG: hypothetical protein AOA65_1148 [Candidatus Bathyarchaeota archaeon BA1]|nr:MAG: hypothetical protein AOA65_1148 [Candidatus Bathyarchaeota archaeon BA1]
MEMYNCETYDRVMRLPNIPREDSVMFESVEDLIRAHEGIEREVYLDLENSNAVPMEIVEAMIPYFSERAYGQSNSDSQTRVDGL